MKANEFISESELKQSLYEKGMWDTIKQGAKDFAAGAGEELKKTFLSQKDLDRLAQKKAPGQLADAIAQTISSQAAQVFKRAEERGIDVNDPKVAEGIKGIVQQSMSALKLDPTDQKLVGQINKLAKDVIANPADVSGIKNAVEPLVKVSMTQTSQAAAKHGKTEVFQQASLNYDEETGDPTIIVKKGTKWEKYVADSLAGGFKQQPLDREDMTQLNQNAKQYNLASLTVKRIGPDEVDLVDDKIKGNLFKDAPDAQTGMPPGETEKGVDFKELYKGIATHIKQNPDVFDTDDPQKDLRNMKDFVINNLKKNGVPQDKAEQLTPKIIKNIAPELMARTPGSADRLQKFSGEVFFPQGRRDSETVYANHEGRWSMWKKVKPTVWEFVRDISNPEQVGNIETAIAASGGALVPQNFKYLQQDYYKVN